MRGLHRVNVVCALSPVWHRPPQRPKIISVPEIVLATLNAKYIHSAFGLRYLRANLGVLRERSVIVEFDINQRPLDIVETLLGCQPSIIGFGIYIWNTAPTLQVVSLLKRLRPEIVIILGGPEVSYETEGQEIVALADYVVVGEADLKFAELCGQLLLGGTPPTEKIVHAPLPQMERLLLPYDLYDDADVAHRIVYVEASRGCPFTCEFCLSSLDIPVRQVGLERLLPALERLLERGVRQFKFVDRTFNLNLNVGRQLLQFFMERLRPGLFLHFEMIPDRLPAGLRELIALFPPGALQFEVGIQSFNDEVCRLISRRQDVTKLEENFRFLRASTGVHLHADLIVGLPGESLESFGAGFDRLVSLGPQEIQVGLLKRLRGTPIIRHDAEWGLVYAEHPPYEILRTRLLSFEDVQKLRRFARYWDLIANSGNFVESTRLLWSGGASAFAEFMTFTGWLYGEIGRTHAIALNRLGELLFRYLVEVKKLDAGRAAQVIWEDYERAGRRDKPGFLGSFVEERPVRGRSAPESLTPKRQRRHVGTSPRRSTNAGEVVREEA